MPCTTPGCGLHPDQTRPVVDEPTEDADGVGATAHTSDDHIGHVTEHLDALRPRLLADDPVEFAHHERIRVRAHHRTEAVVGGLDSCHPVAHRLVDCILQRAAAAVHGLHLAAEQLHPEHVQCLTLDVDGTHVHLALHAQQRCSSCRGDTVLTSTRLGDQPLLAHSLGEQRLAEDVVDLVRTGVVEILALQHQPNAELLAEVLALGEDRRATRVRAQHMVELGTEHGIGPCFGERDLELLARGHQGFGYEPTTELAKATGGRRLGHQRHCFTLPVLYLVESFFVVGPVVGHHVGPDVLLRRRSSRALDEGLDLQRILAARRSLDTR
jgi:hypothetical protein